MPAAPAIAGPSPRRNAALWFSVLSALFASPGLSQNPPNGLGAWLAGAPAPTARSEVAAAAIEGKIYVIGGLEEAGPSDLSPVAVSRRVEEYDPIWNGWTAKAQLPVPLHHAAVAVIDRHVYVVGGFTKSGLSIWTPVATLYRYHPVTDTWTEQHPMPTARGALAAAVVDHKLVAIGGYDGQRNTGAVEIYDPATDSWTTGASLPTPRDHLAAVAVGRDLYAIGGRLNRDYAHNLGVVERYQPAANRWERRADLPTPRSGLAAVALGGRIFTFGGEGTEGTFRDTESYTPETDRWRALAGMPIGRHGLGAAAAQDRIYLVSGGPKPGATFSNVTEIYVPPTGETGATPAGRASAAQVGAVMAILAAWSEAGVLPPESTPEANRIVKALIQFQSAMMKSTNTQVVQFFDGAFAHKFGAAAEEHLRQSRRNGWTSRTLEAVVEYATGPPQWDQGALDAGWREFNVGSQDLRLLAGLHAAAREQFVAEGKDIHAVYDSKRRLMPGAR